MSGGFRSITLYRVNDLAFSVYGYRKSKRTNITEDELTGFTKLADGILNYHEEQLQTAVQTEVLREVICHE